MKRNLKKPKMIEDKRDKSKTNLWIRQDHCIDKIKATVFACTRSVQDQANSISNMEYKVIPEHLTLKEKLCSVNDLFEVRGAFFKDMASGRSPTIQWIVSYPWVYEQYKLEPID